MSKDDDFSELLIQHVTHTNKMLQRDLQEQSRKMLAEQKRQAEHLAAQVAGLTAPGDAAEAPSTTPTLTQAQQHGHQHNNSNQKSALQSRNNQGNNNNNGQPHQKRQQTPFVPKKDCMYFLQGTCRKVCFSFILGPHHCVLLFKCVYWRIRNLTALAPFVHSLLLNFLGGLYVQARY